MTEILVKTTIFSVVALFIIICLLWKKPVSDGGKLSFRLCLVNALGWFFILPFSDKGHPPPFLFPMLLFWLINLPLLPATAASLWVCLKAYEEKVSYLAIASAYVSMNVIVLFISPLVWLVHEASR